jgi:hypothetical protein
MKTEADIFKMKGRVADNYLGLKNYLDNIDRSALEYLVSVGLASSKEEYLHYSHCLETEVRNAYVRKQVDKIAIKVEEAVKKADAEGREGNYKGIPVIDKFATFTKNNLPFDSYILHDGELLRRKINRKMVQNFNQDFKKNFAKVQRVVFHRFIRTNKNEAAEEAFLDAILFDPEEGLSIDADKYLEIYRSRTEAERTQFYQKHLAAAEAVNNFFGNLCITEKEMNRYFMLYGGKVKPNPKSVNVQSYMRLKW